MAPGADVLLRTAGDVAVPLEVGAPAAFAGGAEDAVELGEGELGDRVVLVDEDAERVAPAGHVVRAGAGDDLGDVVIVLALEREPLRPEDAAAGDADIGCAGPQGPQGGGGALQVPFDLHARLDFPKLLLPDLGEAAVGKVVVPPDAQFPRDLLFRLVGGQTGQIEAVGRVERLRPALADEPLPGLLQLESILAAARRACSEENGGEQEQAGGDLQCGHGGPPESCGMEYAIPLNRA